MKQRKNAIHFLIISLVMAIVLTAFSGCGRKGRTTTETEDTTMGIDVARYQGTIDWQQVAQSGIDFAMIRVGYRSMSDGEIKPDPNGRYNLQEASKAGIPMGAYFFSTALTEEEAMEEAAWVADMIAGYPITYPVVYDCEGFNDPESRQYTMSKEERTDVALAFLKTIEDLGYEAMFYASKVDLELENSWETFRIEEEYKIWVAQYPSEPYPATPESSYSGVHQMWQYSMEGSVPGISQPVDLNVAYFGYDGIEKPKSKKTPEEVEPDIEAMFDFREVSEQVTAKDETNLRDIPSQDTDSNIMTTLQNGQIAHRIAVSPNGWSKVVYEGNVYYAVSNYLTTVSGETDIVVEAEASTEQIQTQFYDQNQQVTAKEVVNLRKLPSVEHEDAEVIAQLKNGDIATCIGVSDNGWSKLNFRGTICYAISSYLTPITEMIAEAQEGDDFDIPFSPRQEQVTTNDKVNLRTIPSTERSDSKVITQLQSGDVVIRVGISDNGWSKLLYNGTTCYAVSRYLVPVGDISGAENEVQTKFVDLNDSVTPKVEVNLRSLPSVEDPACVVVATIKNGEVVQRTGVNIELGWSRVEYNGQTLYCISSYLKLVE